MGWDKKMSENKKYFYLKLKDNFFSSEEMLVLESVPEGMIYQNIYLRMCLLSLKNEGALTFKNMLPYDLKMLATVLRVDVSKMKLALELFEQLGLVTKTNNEVLFMADIQTLIDQSSTEGERVAKCRKRSADSNNVTQKDNNVTQMLPEEKKCTKSVQMLQSCTPELEIEKELEINLKKEINSCSKQTSCSEPKDSTISLILNDNSEWTPSQSEIDEFTKLYPNVDVIAELRKMRGWCIGNPKRRKTRYGIKRFVTSWLGKEQDKPSIQKTVKKEKTDWSGQYTDEEYMQGMSDLETVGF